MADVPSPLEWHPAYRDKPWLLDWLEGRGQYANPHRAMYNLSRAEYPTEPTPDPIVLTRQQCQGPAPYVGRPFAYVWPVGVDNLGRCIAGEAQIVYENEKWLDDAMLLDADS